MRSVVGGLPRPPVLPHRGIDPAHQGSEPVGHAHAQQRLEPPRAERLPRLVLGLDQAVREQEQRVLVPQLHRALLVSAARVQARRLVPRHWDRVGNSGDRSRQTWLCSRRGLRLRPRCGASRTGQLAEERCSLPSPDQTPGPVTAPASFRKEVLAGLRQPAGQPTTPGARPDCQSVGPRGAPGSSRNPQGGVPWNSERLRAKSSATCCREDRKGVAFGSFFVQEKTF